MTTFSRVPGDTSAGIAEDAPPSRRRDCHFDDDPLPIPLKHLLKEKGKCSRMTVSPTARRAAVRLGYADNLVDQPLGLADVRLPPSQVDQHVAIGIATEAVQPPGSTDSPERRSA